MDIRRRMLFIKNASSSEGEGGGSTTGGTYTVNLNSQWEKTTAISNPDSILYDGVYRSASNYNVNSGVAIMYITIKDCSSFKMYIRSYAESNYDYVMVSQLDKTINGNTSYSNTTLVKAHTRGNQQSGTALSSYTLVEYTGITSGEHTITVVYRKDSSVNNGDDRGYVLIEKSQAGSGDSGEDDGEVDIDTTYAIYYTSSDGNIVTPYSTKVFGANIVSNNYINGQGIISFDGPVTTIGWYAFKNCDGLTSVTIPDSVTTIGEGAFGYCSSLTSVTIPDSVTTIGSSAFNGCSSLTSVTIPDSVTTIGEGAFNDCSSLKSITIPNSVTTIEYVAFLNCTSLISVNIPDSVTEIGHNAFQGCTSLISVTIGDSVITVGNYAFSRCSRLTSVYCKPATPPAGYSGMFSNVSGRKIYVPMESVNKYKSASGWSDYASDIVGYNF